MRARRRAILAALVSAVRQMLSIRETNPDHDIGGAHHNDEEVLDEYLRGHERGYSLGLRRSHDRGYRQGVTAGYAHGLSHGQQVAYDAGFEAGIAYNRE